MQGGQLYWSFPFNKDFMKEPSKIMLVDQTTSSAKQSRWYVVSKMAEISILNLNDFLSDLNEESAAIATRWAPPPPVQKSRA